MKNTLALLGLSAVLLAFPGYAKDGGEAQSHGSHMERGDGDRDGRLSKDEYLKRAERRFEKTDADKDGQLSKDERKAAFEEMKAKRAEWKAKHKSGGEHEGVHESH